jgi:hypothetical protein
MECYVHPLSWKGYSVFLDRDLASRPQHRHERMLHRIVTASAYRLGTTLEMVAVVIKDVLVHIVWVSWAELWGQLLMSVW